jgi:hypothetical protein
MKPMSPRARRAALRRIRLPDDASGVNRIKPRNNASATTISASDGVRFCRLTAKPK